MPLGASTHTASGSRKLPTLGDARWQSAARRTCCQLLHNESYLLGELGEEVAVAVHIEDLFVRHLLDWMVEHSPKSSLVEKDGLVIVSRGDCGCRRGCCWM